MSSVRNVISLHSFDDCLCQNACQHGVFAQGLFKTSPTSIASKVKNRSETNLSSLQTHFECHRLSHLLQQIGIKSAGLPYSGGKGSRSDCHVSVSCFFGKENRNAQSGIFDCITLHLVHHFGTLTRVKSAFESFLRPRVGSQYRPSSSYRHIVHSLLEKSRQFDRFVICLFVHKPTQRAE